MEAAKAIPNPQPSKGMIAWARPKARLIRKAIDRLGRLAAPCATAAAKASIARPRESRSRLIIIMRAH